MRPSDALAYKRMFLERCRTKGSDDNDDQGPGRMADVTRTLCSFLPHCPTYYVSADMVAVARRAGETLPPGTDIRTAAPSSEGFMYFDAPIYRQSVSDDDDEDSSIQQDLDINTVIWWTSKVVWREIEGTDGASTMDMTPDATGTPVLHAMQIQLGRDGSRTHRMINIGLNPLNDGLPEKAEDASLWATWILMQQSLVVSENATPERPERKRCMRAQVQPQYVIVRLRRIEQRGEQEEDSAVNWSHRWLVGGHWRQQYYPSRGGNSPIWINPYVKGPEGKPLVVKEKVTAWVR